MSHASDWPITAHHPYAKENLQEWIQDL